MSIEKWSMRRLLRTRRDFRAYAGRMEVEAEELRRRADIVAKEIASRRRKKKS